MLTGCWSNRPVEFRAIVLMMGISPAPHHQLRLTVQIPTRAGLTSLTGGSSTSSGRQSFYTLSATGPTLGMALNRIQSQVQSDVYLTQTRVIVLSCALDAQQFGLAERWLERMGPMDKTAYIVASASARKILSASPAQGGLPSLALTGGFGCAGCQTTFFRQQEWNIETAIASPGTSIWIPYVTAVRSGFQGNRVAIYDGFRPALILSPEETTVFGYLLGRTVKGNLAFHVGRQQVGIRTITGHPHVTTIAGNGRIQIRLTLNLQGTLDTWNGPALTPTVIHRIAQSVDQRLATQAAALVRRFQAQGLDPDGWITPVIWRSRQRLGSTAQWQPAFRHAAVTVRVRFHFIDVGDSY